MPLGLALGIAALIGWSAWAAGDNALTVYCAHDSLYAEEVLRAFEQRTGIPVRVRYDTEAQKSLGLSELIARERDAPRCDVFWNNEVLGTMRLADEGLLEPYRGPGFLRIPARWKDADARWAGFAGRLRVFIVNVERLPGTRAAVRRELETRLGAGDLSRVAVAKPLYGTTRTQYTVLWALCGGDALAEWHARWRAASVREVTGNATVKDLVAAGSCDFGLTDSDDYFLARDRGAPVAMVPVELGDLGELGDFGDVGDPDPAGRAICVPNTVAIVRGCRRADAARALCDFLLSAETELALARSRSRQLPLGPVVRRELPDEVRVLMPCVDSACDLAWLERATEPCLAWLRSEYLR